MNTDVFLDSAIANPQILSHFLFLSLKMMYLFPLKVSCKDEYHDIIPLAELEACYQNMGVIRIRK